MDGWKGVMLIYGDVYGEWGEGTHLLHNRSEDKAMINK